MMAIDWQLGRQTSRETLDEPDTLALNNRLNSITTFT